jgi:Holliday junction resolvase
MRPRARMRAPVRDDLGRLSHEHKEFRDKWADLAPGAPIVSRRGHDRERAVRVLLDQDGWWTARAAGSLGDADVIALKAGFPPRLVEVKSTAAGPFEHFGPADRAALSAAARRAGAEAWLVWWPSRRKPIWLHELDWPETRRTAA